MAITGDILQKFVQEAADRLEGDWVIIGGTVLPLLGVTHRTTLDIDVAGPRDAGSSAALTLMEIAHGLGLPVEAVNQAGAFFLHRIEGWRNHIVPIRKGSQATVFRPDATLFILLKLGRLSESDLSDCVEILRLAETLGESPDSKRLLGAIGAELEKAHPRRRVRLEELKALLV